MSQTAAPTTHTQAELSANALRSKQAGESRKSPSGATLTERKANERRAKSIPQFAEDWDLSPSMVWKLIRTGRVEAVKVGARTLITTEAEAKYEHSLPRAGIAA
jgi:hypothetical protein